MKAHKKESWVKKDVELLVKMWLQRYSIKDIGQRLERKEAIIRAKVSHLRRSSSLMKEKLFYRNGYEGPKLCAADIPKIRKDKRTLEMIGKDHHVAAVTIHKIKTGKLWKNV